MISQLLNVPLLGCLGQHRRYRVGCHSQCFSEDSKTVSFHPFAHPPFKLPGTSASTNNARIPTEAETLVLGLVARALQSRGLLERTKCPAKPHSRRRLHAIDLIESAGQARWPDRWPVQFDRSARQVQAVRRLMRPDDMLETFSELAVKEPDLMRLVLQASVAALVNAQSMMAADDEIQRRAAKGN